jgi:hypothetical protein
MKGDRRFAALELHPERLLSSGTRDMIWQLCIQYSNGHEKVLRSFYHRENALQCIDAIYRFRGYPLHLAYVVRQGQIA